MIRALLLAALALAGCDRLRPGFCERQEHCPAGQVCDLEGRVAFRQCILPEDAGQRSSDGPYRPPTPLPGPAGGDSAPAPEVDAAGAPAEPDAALGCSAGAPCPPERPMCVDNQCVECAEDAHCADPVRKFCVAGRCADCRMAAATACQAPTPVCDPASGTCVACVASTSCTDPKAPFCATNHCVGCAMAAPQTCAQLNAARGVCGPDGACVECNTSMDCTADAARPICVNHACAACTADPQCAARAPNPGICLTHLGGRCASDAETIYVERTASCGSAGTSAIPLCSIEAALPLVSETRNVIVARGLLDGFAWNTLPAKVTVSIIGQAAPVIAGGFRSGVRLSGAGAVYMRGFTVSSSELPGIWVDNGATIRLDSLVIDRNRGGGIRLSDARFDLHNVRVRGNGVGETGPIIWGGILIQAPLAGGPARLERVSIVDNQQIGLTCDAPIESLGVYAHGNTGGVDIAARCNVEACPGESPSCGATLSPLP